MPDPAAPASPPGPTLPPRGLPPIPALPAWAQGAGLALSFVFAGILWRQGADEWLIFALMVLAVLIVGGVAPHLAAAAPLRSTLVSRISAAFGAGAVTGFFVAGGLIFLGQILDNFLTFIVGVFWFKGPLIDVCTSATAGLAFGAVLCSLLGACQTTGPPVARTIFVLSKHTRWITAAAFSPDDRLLATASYDGSIRLWKVGTGEEALAITGLTSGVTALVFDPAGQRLASATDGMVHLWDVTDGRRLLEIPAHRGRTWAIAFSPDGARLTTVGDDAAVKQWNAATGAEHWASTAQADQLAAVSAHVVAWSPDGRWLATGGRDAIVRLWDAETGVARHRLEAHAGNVEALAFSPDGRRLVSGGDDQTVRIWQVEAGKLLLTLRGHQGSVRAATFSADGQVLATGSEDRTARLWRAASGESFARLLGHQAGVSSVSFSRNGTVLATGSGDATVRVWALST